MYVIIISYESISYTIKHQIIKSNLGDIKLIHYNRMTDKEQIEKLKREIVFLKRPKDLEIINKLFLELSQFATAKTQRELELEHTIAKFNAR